MKIIVANLKMNLSLGEIIAYEQTVSKAISGNPAVIICPQYPFLTYFNKGNYNLGAQDVSRYPSGSYTGDVSAKDLFSMDVEYVIVGHSERRRNYKENEEEILAKINNIFDNGMIPILCIGENKEEKQKKKTAFVLQKQISEIFNKISIDNIKKIIIAYEPIWTIGANKTPSNEEIDETIGLVKDYILKTYRVENKFLYGGSVSDFNIATLNSLVSCDGFLVGNSSVNPLEFINIINACSDKY